MFAKFESLHIKCPWKTTTFRQLTSSVSYGMHSKCYAHRSHNNLAAAFLIFLILILFVSHRGFQWDSYQLIFQPIATVLGQKRTCLLCFVLVINSRFNLFFFFSQFGSWFKTLAVIFFPLSFPFLNSFINQLFLLKFIALDMLTAVLS